MTRIQIELSEQANLELEALMEEVGLRTKKDLINNALTLLEWAIRARQEGWRIVALNEKEGKLKELVLPILENAARSSEKKTAAPSSEGKTAAPLIRTLVS
jgi:hypothetical protein